MTMTMKAQAVPSVSNVPSSDQNIRLLVIFAFFCFVVLFLGLFRLFANSLGRTSSLFRSLLHFFVLRINFLVLQILSSMSQVKKILPKLQAVKQRTGDVLISWTDTR